MSEYFQELFQTGLYKRTQGKNVRQVTLITIMVVVAAGVWSLKLWMEAEGQSSSLANGVPLAVLLACGWAAFRLVQWPRFADFLISVEAEMSKVSWPSRNELLRASAVVIIVIFLLAVILFAYDFIWKSIFSAVLG